MKQTLEITGRFRPYTSWQFSIAALEAAEKIPAGSVSEQSHQRAHVHAEPLLICMDSLYQYAASYHGAYEGRLKDDNVLGPEWLAALRGVHGLLNGDGAVAMARQITTDTKCNGAMEGLYWAALAMAGYDKSDLN